MQSEIIIYKRLLRDLGQIYLRMQIKNEEVHLNKNQCYDVLTQLGFINTSNFKDLELWEQLWSEMTQTETILLLNLKTYICAIQKICFDWMS